MTDEQKSLKELEDHLGADGASELIGKLRGMHNKGASSEELQKEIVKAVKDKGGEDMGDAVIAVAAIVIAAKS